MLPFGSSTPPMLRVDSFDSFDRSDSFGARHRIIYTLEETEKERSAGIPWSRFRFQGFGSWFRV